MNYYLRNHIPMVRQKLGSACKSVAVEAGIAGGSPAVPATCIVMALQPGDTFQAAFRPHVGAIMSDIPNYTNAQPTVQISQVKM
jgi:uncharacterized protein (TIGR02118 family)